MTWGEVVDLCIADASSVGAVVGWIYPRCFVVAVIRLVSPVFGGVGDVYVIIVMGTGVMGTVELGYHVPCVVVCDAGVASFPVLMTVGSRVERGRFQSVRFPFQHGHE